MITNTAAAVPTSPLPALGDSSDGVTFTMLGASIRLIARATDTDGRFTVFENLRYAWADIRPDLLPNFVRARTEHPVAFQADSRQVGIVAKEGEFRSPHHPHRVPRIQHHADDGF